MGEYTMIVVIDEGENLSTTILRSEVIPCIGDIISYHPENKLDRVDLIVKTRVLIYDQYGILSKVHISENK